MKLADFIISIFTSLFKLFFSIVGNMATAKSSRAKIDHGFQAFQGEVISKERFDRNDTSITEFWIRDRFGNEKRFFFTDSVFPFIVGQELRVVYSENIIMPPGQGELKSHEFPIKIKNITTSDKIDFLYGDELFYAFSNDRKNIGSAIMMGVSILLAMLSVSGFFSIFEHTHRGFLDYIASALLLAIFPLLTYISFKVSKKFRSNNEDISRRINEINSELDDF